MVDDGRVNGLGAIGIDWQQHEAASLTENFI